MALFRPTGSVHHDDVLSSADRSALLVLALMQVATVSSSHPVANDEKIVVNGSVGDKTWRIVAEALVETSSCRYYYCYGPDSAG